MILDGGAGYVLALKENQGRLYEDVRGLFDGAEEFGFEGCLVCNARLKGRRRRFLFLLNPRKSAHRWP